MLMGIQGPYPEYNCIDRSSHCRAASLSGSVERLAQSQAAQKRNTHGRQVEATRQNQKKRVMTSSSAADEHTKRVKKCDKRSCGGCGL